VQVPAVKRAGAHVLAWLVPKFTMANEIDYKDLTHDQAVIAEYEKDTLRHDRTSSVLYLEMVKAMSDVFARAPKIQLPSIVQQAGADVIVSPEATRKLFPLLGSPDKTWYEYDGFKHEIFNETERARVFKDLKTWLARWTQPSKSRTTAEHVR
ncbi:MAG: alpha/beta hydrolase, partial [Bdellovibrionia bacterium]